jgi:hypothetical protein
MAKAPTSVGDRELDLLRWLEAQGDATVAKRRRGSAATPRSPARRC